MSTTSAATDLATTSNRLPPGSWTGRHVVITGANTGIGYFTVLRLLEAGAAVTMLGRSEVRNRAAIESLVASSGRPAVDFTALDLSDLDSVRTAAEQVLRGPRIDALINNAGIASTRGITQQGFELAFGTNHLGHYLLTRLLLPHVNASGRIINVSSTMHRKTRSWNVGLAQGRTRTYAGLREYSYSKLANVLFTKELARRVPVSHALVTALHPGAVVTEVYRRMPRPIFAIMKWMKPMLTAEQGAATTLHCATVTPSAALHGAYFDDCKVAPVSRLADDPALAGELWRRSAEWTGLPAE